MTANTLNRVVESAVEHNTPVLLVSTKSHVEIVSQILGIGTDLKLMELSQRVSKVEKAPIYLACGITSIEDMCEYIHSMTEKFHIREVYIDEMVL